MRIGVLVKNNARNAPPSDSGNADKIVIGWNTRANSSTSTANTINTPAATAIAKFDTSSLMNSVSPVSMKRTPVGRFFMDGSALTFSIASPSCYPGARSASI